MSESIGARVATSSALRIWLCGVATIYVLLAVTGVTTSSLGISYLSTERGANARGVVIGTPRAIRSDEFFRATPWLLGLMERGDDGFASPLAFPDVALVAPTARNLPAALLHWEAVAARLAAVLPDSLVFAAIWWFPVVLVAALLPLWMTRLGARPGIAICTTSLVLLAPVNHWWSWGPVGVLAAPLLGAVLALAGFDRWRHNGPNVLSVCAFTVASLCVAKAGLGYAPWTIPLTAAVFVPTLAAALSSGSRRLGLVSLGYVFAAGIALAGALTGGSSAVEVIASTFYPGARRSIGEFVGWGLLLGAPHVWMLQAGPEIARGTNESELTGSYLVLAVPSVVLAAAIRWRDVTLRAPVLAAGGVLLCCLTWVVVDWPESIGRRLVPLTLVPPDRLAQVLGIVATVVFGLVLSAWTDAPRRDPRWVALTAGSLTAVATAVGGRALQSNGLPTMPSVAVVLVALAIGAAVGVAVRRPDRVPALAALPLLALLVVFAANPLQHGLGDLRSSRAAAAVTEVGRSLGDESRWASEDPAFDALLMATGQPSLSGQQWLGPREVTWRALDPSAGDRHAWNRGASFVYFRWIPGDRTRITTIGRDVILVRADPCASALRRLGLALVVARRPLRAPCLIPRGKIAWGHADRWLYGL